MLFNFFKMNSFQLLNTLSLILLLSWHLGVSDAGRLFKRTKRTTTTTRTVNTTRTTTMAKPTCQSGYVLSFYQGKYYCDR
jgi:hypothetical protein